ncbi:glycosyltransferase family 9 protein [Salinimicrobium marinum]|nr:glycosyltransferase family 9 protein [Salinimicrobium marinum]
MKILVIQQKMIGDVLTSSILFEALRKKYPDAELHYLIYTHTFPVVEHNPFIDRILLFDPVVDLKPNGLLPLLKKIKKEKYDLVIDVYAKINTAIISAFSGATKRISYYKKYTSGAYTHTFELLTSPKTSAGLAIENRMLLLTAVAKDFPAELKPKLYLTKEEISSAKALMKNAGIEVDKPVYMIGILGSSSEKTYPLKYMAEILNKIISSVPAAQLLFNYIPSQEKEAKELYNLCSPQTQQHIFFETYGRSLREFMAITAQCDALIGNEGGAVNMAKALNVPTFSIFSPQIKKENWSIYENEADHVSVHLKDYHPEFLTALSRKTLTKKAAQFYEQLKPNLILAKLNTFLQTNSSGKIAELKQIQ